MNCFVTGCSGFIGANLLHELVLRGHRVKALVRPGADRRGTANLPFEPVEGDLANAEALEPAMRGCDWCFHVAASYHLWLADYRPMYATNVDGTRQVLTAAGRAGVSRIVYTSTVGCIGLPTASNGAVTPTNEDSPVSEAQMTNHYKRSKWQAELVARALAKKGLPVVIVNPSAPVGPRDVKPTPTGQVIVDFLNRAMPAYLETGLNWVHVRDVAVGHILAAEKGRVGERYILGHHSGNWTLKQAFRVLEELTGIRRPRMRLPYFVAWIAAQIDERVSALTGRAPKAPLAGVRMARHKMYFDPSKAVRELGLPQTDPKQAMADAVTWFQQNGYIKKAR
jgi:dihydroflavonol-4-reductase